MLQTRFSQAKRVLISGLAAFALAGAGHAQPEFDKAFLPDTIGPGSVATLQFDIQNLDEIGVTDLAFTDVLPAGVFIADPANASTDCGLAILSAPAGGTTISFSDGTLAPVGDCFVTVNVTSAAVGTNTNVSGDLTSSAGNSGPAIADLIVDDARPGFSKVFSPNPIVTGDTSTLTLTIDNTANGSDQFFSISFTDNLPGGLVVAPVPNATSDCDLFGAPTITANPGAGSISFANGSVDTAASCFVSVDVIAQTAGPKGNTTGDLLVFRFPDFAEFNSGKAGATLEVETQFLIKIFPDDPAPPGGTVTLQFTLTNFSRVDSATGITFTDDLEATLTGLEAIGLPLADPCGAGSQLSGTDLLALTGGNLGPEASCTFGVTLQVPGGAVPGTYVNITSSVVVNVGDDVVVEDPATDNLVIAPVPIFTKSFTDDPVTAGGTVTLEFSITNTSTTASATDITFSDFLFDGIPSAAAVPGADPCGAGSSATFTPPSDFTPPTITLSGGNLAPSASCTFAFILNISPDLPSGAYLNTTSAINATIDGEPISGPPASDTLEVVAAPDLTKDFIDDPVLPGGTVTLEFTLTLGPESPGPATDIAFTDDLDAVISGLEAVGLPLDDICGAGSQLSGTSLLSFTDGSLAPGASCTFAVTLQVPGGILPGNRTNTTSSVTAMSLGLPVSSAPASAELVIGGLTFTKSFTDDPSIAGDTVTLEFTIDNLSSVAGTTDMFFTDDLDSALEGLVGTGLPIPDACGPGSQLAGAGGNSLLFLTDGNLAPLTSCTFSVTLQIPGAAEAGDYPNTTSQLSAMVGGSPVTVNPATDVLTIVEPLAIDKFFIDDPVAPGDLVTLGFTVSNTVTASATGISFTDDLEATLPGLVAVGLPANDVCGAGSQLSGSSLITLTGGSLPPDTSCNFEVTLQVPVDAPLDTFPNTTSDVTGTIEGLPVSGGPATDDLIVEVPVCLAANGENLTLEEDTVDDTQFFEVCDTITVGPNYQVVGANGNLTLRAGVRIILRNGAAVTTGGKLSLGLDPNLQP